MNYKRRVGTGSNSLFDIVFNLKKQQQQRDIYIIICFLLFVASSTVHRCCVGYYGGFISFVLSCATRSSDAGNSYIVENVCDSLVYRVQRHTLRLLSQLCVASEGSDNRGGRWSARIMTREERGTGFGVYSRRGVCRVGEQYTSTHKHNLRRWRSVATQTGTKFA